MEASPVLNGILMGWFLAFWLCARLVDVIVPISWISASGLRAEGDCSIASLIREKVDIVLANSRDATAVLQWFIQQIRMDHLIADVLSSQHFWLTMFGVSVAGFITQSLVFDLFITVKNAPEEYFTEMKRSEMAYVQETTRKFFVEKVLVLAYVVVRNQDRSHFATTRQPNVNKWTYHETEATVFAIWFTLIWSVSSLMILADQRFEMISRLVSGKNVGENGTSKELSEGPKQEVMNKQPEEDPNNVQQLMKRLILVLMACFFTATAMTSFGLTSFKVVHILYALMFAVEGLQVLLYSVYVIYRVAWWQMVANPALHDSETFRKRAYDAKRIADVLLSSLSVVQYLLYLIVGTIINGKLIPLVFVGQLTYHLQHSIGSLFDRVWRRDTSAVAN